jgi:hypothetical protein
MIPAFKNASRLTGGFVGFFAGVAMCTVLGVQSR